MAKQYSIKVGATRDMGSYKTTVAADNKTQARERALWDYNNARAHDGLGAIPSLPSGHSCDLVVTQSICKPIYPRMGELANLAPRLASKIYPATTGRIGSTRQMTAENAAFDYAEKKGVFVSGDEVEYCNKATASERINWLIDQSIAFAIKAGGAL